MRKQSSPYGPDRGLTCVQVEKKDRAYLDPGTRITGRCGNCHPCWRLFVWACKQQGVPVPRANHEGRVFHFNVARRQRRSAQRG